MRDDGLTNEEGDVMDYLVGAYTAYDGLEVEHPSDPGEFVQAIHRAQDLLAVRVVRRAYPDGWYRA